MTYPDISNLPYVILDTETTGLKWYRDRPFCLAVAAPGIKSFVVDLEDSVGLRWACKQIPQIKRAVFHNAKFDCHMLRNLDVKFNYDKVDCTLIMATLVNEHEHSFSLDHLSEKYLTLRKMTGLYDRLAEIYGGPATKKQMNNIYPCWKSPNRQLVVEYALQDVEVTKALYEFLSPEIEKQDLGKVYKLEMDLMPVLMDMERQGVSVDLERTEETRKRLVKQIEEEQLALNEIAGFNVNINSPKDLPMLFGAKCISAISQPGWAFDKNIKDVWVTSTGEPLPLTPGGKASFSAESLQSLKDERAKMVLGIRQTDKLVSTFIDGHILGSHQNGRVHTNFNQTRQEVEYGTVTGRLSSSEPNLQQIPKRNKILAQQIRSLFIPEKGDIWHCWDYSQIDFRFFAHYVNNPDVIKQYENNPDIDFHQMVADMTGLPRTSTPGIKGNCFDSETEYLSPTGWCRISEYEGGPVGQYTPGKNVDDVGIVGMVEPIQYIKEISDEICDVRDGDMVITPGHRLLYWRKSGHGPWKVFDQNVGKYMTMGVSRTVKIPTSWVEERKGINLTDIELKISIALQADGSLDKYRCRFGFKLIRKIERLCGLLDEAGIKYTKSIRKAGVTYIYFVPPLRSKSFGDAIWYDASVRQRGIIINEMCHWDGHFHKLGYKVFYSTDKKSADYIQWAASSIGMRASLYHTNDEYRTSFNAPNPKRVWQVRCDLKTSYTINPKQIKLKKGIKDVYCFTLPSGFMPVRRNGRVYISGQSKQLNLGLVFGMGEGTMSEEMGLPFTIEKGRNGKEYKKAGEEALEVFRRYHKAIPGIKDFLQKASSVAIDRGYVKSIMGRRLRFPNRGMSYKAGGYLFQSATAELIKLKLIEIHHALKGTEGKLLLSVHDEADISMPPDPALQKRITEVLEDFKLRIPIRCSLGVGPDWWEASK